MIICTLNMEMARHRMNIQQLADKSGLSRSTISMLYHDKAKRIDFDTLEKLCEALDTSPGRLLTRMSFPEEENE